MTKQTDAHEYEDVIAEMRREAPRSLATCLVGFGLTIQSGWPLP